MLQGALCVVAPFTAAQPLVATLFQLIFASLVLKLAPFESDFDDIASFVSASAMVLMLLTASALFMQGHATNDEQFFNPIVLEVILITLTVGALVLQLSVMTRVIPCPERLCFCGTNSGRSRPANTNHLEKKEGENMAVEMVGDEGQKFHRNPMKNKSYNRRRSEMEVEGGVEAQF